MKKVFGLVLTLVTLAPLVASACDSTGFATGASSVFGTSAAVESSTFTWAFRKGTGNFSASSALNEAPGESCRVCVYYRIGAAGTRKALKCKNSSKKTTTFRASKLRGVAITNSNKAARLVTMASQTTCGETVISSNSYARYPDCGKGSTEYKNSGLWATAVKKSVS